ncbi:helix-turn-helix domain-containing protein [Streptomyces zaomyceticus]|uniref:helix-turn-helix domain-containing protein n=1 Tax=Streptomyces zaomyceticus TaxID=68286 RepID=UPI0033A06B57
MSLLPILWAMKSAPVADAEERAILIAMAESAWSDGTDAFQSKKTIAEIAVIDPKTVQRRLKTLKERGLIAEGNQAAAAYIPEYYRPTVYDLLIPYAWFPDIEQVNAERKGRSKPPLTRANRPDLAPAPPRKHRADKGKKRPKKETAPDLGGDSQGSGDYKSPGQTGQEGGTASPGGGDYKSQTGGLQDPQPSPSNPPQDPPRPSVPQQRHDGNEDGGTDGIAAPQKISSNEGVELLLAIGAAKPEFLLTGTTLRDQGLMVTGMLAEGWTAEHLWQVIAGRGLPSPIRTTVGAVVSSRLRAALSGPVPRAGSVQPTRQEPETPTPAAWSEEMVVLGDRPGECDGRDGLCGRPTLGGARLCPACSADGVFA